MKTQISRFSFDPDKRYSGVYQQQGRMITDADWNELQSIAKQRLDDALKDAIGSGVPAEGGLTINADSSSGTLTINPGRIYAGGLAGIVLGPGPVDYTQQPDFPHAPRSFGRGDIVYADVWERTVSFLEDEGMRDPALGGPDTCTRTQTMVQIKLVNKPYWDLESARQNPRCGDAPLTVTLSPAVAGTPSGLRVSPRSAGRAGSGGRTDERGAEVVVRERSGGLPY